MTFVRSSLIYYFPEKRLHFYAENFNLCQRLVLTCQTDSLYVAGI